MKKFHKNQNYYFYFSNSLWLNNTISSDEWIYFCNNWLQSRKQKLRIMKWGEIVIYILGNLSNEKIWRTIEQKKAKINEKLKTAIVLCVCVRWLLKLMVYCTQYWSYWFDFSVICISRIDNSKCEWIQLIKNEQIIHVISFNWLMSAKYYLFSV